MNILAEYNSILSGVAFLVLYIILFFFAKWCKGLFSSFNLDEELTQKDNVAVGISAAGYFLGISIIYAGALSGPTKGFAEDLIAVAGYALAGIVLLHLARWINGKLILSKFDVDKEIIKDQNPGTGVVQAASYIASALIIAGAIHGEGGGPVTALVFFALGQIALILFSLLYIRLSPYDIHAEIEKDNTAAGLGFSGGIISIGIITMRAVSGTFVSWQADLTQFGIDLAIVVVYLLGIRFIFDRFILRNSDLNTEISRDKNLGAGLLEMVTAISFSSVLYFLL